MDGIACRRTQTRKDSNIDITCVHLYTVKEHADTNTERATGTEADIQTQNRGAYLVVGKDGHTEWYTQIKNGLDCMYTHINV